MLAKDASEKDILNAKNRLKERQKQRILDIEDQQAISIANRRSKQVQKFHNEKG